jgi:RNA 3'-terminal phosphate cyclase (ATP)
LDLVRIDGSAEGGGGQVLRAALALSAVTGQGFLLERIRARRLRPGLQPQHLAAVRAMALCCGAEVHGDFDGSPDLRFVPHAVAPGEFTFDIAGAFSATLLMQAVAPVLASAERASRIVVLGGTHVPRSPGFHYVAQHWATVVERLGLVVRPSLPLAGFAPKGGGRLECAIEPWARPATLDLAERGALVGVRGVAGWAKLKGGQAQRAADAAYDLLWEARRIESQWDVFEMKAAAPGWFFQLEAVFENGRAAFPHLGERGTAPESAAEREARRLLRFVEDGTESVDPFLADQLALPLGIARGGGRLTTSEVTSHLASVVATLNSFGVPARTFGRAGGPGGLEVDAW